MSRRTRRQSFLSRHWIDIAIVILSVVGLVLCISYAPTERASMVVCKVTGSGRHTTLHTDTGLYNVEVSLIRGKFHPETLAEQIHPGNEYMLTYYGWEVQLGRFKRHPIVIDATLVKSNVHSDAPICNE